VRRGASVFIALVLSLVIAAATPAGAVLGTPVPPVAPPVDPIVDEVERCIDVIVDSAQDGALVDRITGELCNRRPIADAGDDHDAALVGEAVILDGTGSDDPDGDELTFAWSLDPPDGSTAALDDATSATPTFVPDRHGTYVARLTVDDGRTQSDEDEVRIVTVNRPPVANAGPDLSVRADDEAVLDGSASSDPDGDELTYSWALVDAPEGSAATIADDASEQASLVPDVLGDYTVELTVSDGDLSATDTAIVTATHVVVMTLSPAVLHATTFASDALQLTLDRPAPTGGRVVTLASDDPDVASVPDELTVPEGATTATVPVITHAVAGTATVTATSARAAGGEAVVDVALRTMRIHLEDGLVGIGRTVDGAVILDDPAPDGGTVVSLSSSDPGRVSVAPAELTVAAGETSAPFTITGVSEGAVVLRATALGHADAAATTAGTDTVVSIGDVPPMSPGESRDLPISLTEPAPPGGVTVTLSSSDPSIASVPSSVTIAEGQFLPAGNPQVSGHRAGNATVTARTQGYAPDDRAVTVRLLLTLTPNPRRVVVDRSALMTIGLSGPAPAGGQTVSLVSANPARATVPASVVVAAGQTTATFSVTGVSVGQTAVTASTAGATDVSATIHVDPTPVITASDVVVGRDLQESTSVSLSAAPDGPTDITIAVANPSVAVVSTSRTAVGSASVTFAGVTNTSPRTLWVQGLAVGSTSYTVSAPGNASVTRTITVDRAGIGIITGPISTTTFSPNTTLHLSTMRVTPSNTYGGEQEPRAGAPITVDITSSNTSVGTITTSPLTFTAGNGTSPWRKTTGFDPATVGTATIAITLPPGFVTNITYPSSVTATVRAPTFHVTDGAVGKDLQQPVAVTLEVAPPEPVDVTVTISSTDLGLVSRNRTAPGGASVTFTDVSGTNVGIVYLQGLELGTTTLLAQAAGYADRSSPVTVTQAGVAIISGNISVAAGAPNQAIHVSTMRVSNGFYAGEQEPRAGVTITVPVTSSNTAAGTITNSPLTFTAGANPDGWRRIATFDPHAPGQTTVSITRPDGFVANGTYPSSITVTVT